MLGHTDKTPCGLYIARSNINRPAGHNRKDRDTMPTFTEKVDSLYTFDILGTYEGETETVDNFETREEARTMLDEYRMAFGPTWSLRIKRNRKA